MIGYVVQWRSIYSDINVSEWADFNDEPLPTPEDAYAEICRYIHCIPNRIGFVDAPECGMIRTNICYGGTSLFEDPRCKQQQYRIISRDIPQKNDIVRAICL